MRYNEVMDTPISFSLETITPEVAVELLKERPYNRRINKERVRALARLITNGQWQINGQPIILNEAGVLLDGQHRLSAIVEAGIPAICSIAWGVSSSAMQTIDTGRARSAADVLRIDGGYTNTNSLAAAAALVYEWRRGAPRADFGLSISVRPQELLGVLDEFPELPDYLGLADKLVPGRVVSPSIVTFGLWLFGHDDPAAAENFWAKVGDGTNLDSTDPIYRLRETLLGMRGRKAEVRRSFVIALVIKAWNLWRAGKTCKVLALRQGEDFPIPRGYRW